MSNVKPLIKLLLKFTWIAFKISLFVIEFLATVAMGSKSKHCALTQGEAAGLFHEGRISYAEFLDRTS